MSTTKYIDLPKINPVTHVDHPDLPRNKWCGPAAVSILTGMPAEEAAEWIRLRRGQSGTTKGIMSVWSSEVLAALAATGCRITRCDISVRQASRQSETDHRPTLTQWLRFRNRKATYLINAGHHFIVVRGNKACCSRTQEVVSVRKIPGRRSRVEHVWRIQKPARYKFKDLALPKRHKKVWNEKKGHWQLVA